MKQRYLKYIAERLVEMIEDGLLNHPWESETEIRMLNLIEGLKMPSTQDKIHAVQCTAQILLELDFN